MIRAAKARHLVNEGHLLNQIYFKQDLIITMWPIQPDLSEETNDLCLAEVLFERRTACDESDSIA